MAGIALARPLESHIEVEVEPHAHGIEQHQHQHPCAERF